MADMKLDLEMDLYNSFLEEEIDLQELLEAVCTGGSDPTDEFDEGNEGEIISQLLSRHSDEGGSPECEEFSLSEEEYDHNSRKGKVSFNYNVAYYFSCSDMNNDDDHYETVTFDIDVKNEVIIFHFLDYEKRTTREEF